MPRFELSGEHIKAMILDYDTKDVSECAPEAHNKYIDIMIALSGGEGLDMFPRDGLKVTVPYNREDDILWLENGEVPLVHCEIVPGNFVMVWPDEAHRTKQHAVGMNHVKKIVIKLERTEI